MLCYAVLFIYEEIPLISYYTKALRALLLKCNLFSSVHAATVSDV